ncbi:MAG: hypothetical protein LBD38_02450 [Streptococcaceae bacterium]|nr:hypothetical protein [Streptococcaceae bacterium]
MQKTIEQDLVDFWQGISEVELYSDQVNLHGVELIEFQKNEDFFSNMEADEQETLSTLIFRLDEFNQAVSAFTSKCPDFRAIYLAKKEFPEKRNDLMIRFSESVEEIRDMASSLFEEGEKHLLISQEHFEELFYETVELGNGYLEKIKRKQAKYEYTTLKNYISEEEALQKFDYEHIKKHSMARLDFLGEHWYPKYVFYLYDE